MSLLSPLEYLLRAIAETLDVPQSAYDQATERYRAVGDWLCDEGSALRGSKPEVYPQGSFAIGTVVKPLSGDDYDLDAVVELAGSPSSWTPDGLKQAVGNRLKKHETYAALLEPEGRRCWTICYTAASARHGFHLDLLPGVAAHQQAVGETGIAITNRAPTGIVDWRESDPRGYANWFRAQMKTRSQRTAVFSSVAGVDPVPQYRERAPLQYAVQLLKRYRDVLFKDSDEHAPISVILTTLAAQAYRGEEMLEDALFGIIERMTDYVEVRGEKVVISNPIRPTENFADRWQGDVRKVRAFLRWFEAAKALRSELRSLPADKLGARLTTLLGESASHTAMSRFAALRGAARDADAREPSRALRAHGPRSVLGGLASVRRLLADARHRRSPPWPMASDGTTIGIRGFVVGAAEREFVSGEELEVGLDLRFDAVSDSPDAELVWQVTNTGPDAAKAGKLRGNFEPAGASKVESSAYRGDHAIECFVLRNKVCVARSGEFVVSIR